MKQIVAIVLLLCSTMHGSQKTQYKLPVVGQVTPLKVISIAALSAIGYVAYRASVVVRKRDQFKQAIYAGSLDVESLERVRKLVQEQPWLLRVQFENGGTALHAAVHNNKGKLVTLLLELGIEIDAFDAQRCSAEHYAQIKLCVNALEAFEDYHKKQYEKYQEKRKAKAAIEEKDNSVIK